MSGLMGDQLLEEAGVTFLPWQGDNYGNGLKGGRRLLVVGDSNKFTNGDPIQDSDWNRYLVEKCQKGDGYPFYRRIHKLLDEELAKFCTKTEGKYWTYDFISFYNYLITDKIKSGSGGQTTQMYEESEPAMEAVLRELKPTHVLILGKNVWNNFPDKLLNGERTVPDWKGVGKNFKSLWKYPPDHGSFVAAHIYHPSARGKYSFSVQHKNMKNIVSNFLNEEPA